MATLNELKDVLKETLDDRGVLSEIRARIRAEIFGALNDKQNEKPKLSSENTIINELIREYLVFNNYNHTASVFVPESGQPEDPPFDRDYITKRLKVVEDANSRELPLIYGIIFEFFSLFFDFTHFFYFFQNVKMFLSFFKFRMSFEFSDLPLVSTRIRSKTAYPEQN